MRYRLVLPKLGLTILQRDLLVKRFSFLVLSIDTIVYFVNLGSWMDYKKSATTEIFYEPIITYIKS